MTPQPPPDDRTSPSKAIAQLSTLAPHERQDFVNSTAASWIKGALSTSIGSFKVSYSDTMAGIGVLQISLSETNRQLEELRQDILEETYLSNPQPSEEYCKTLAVKLKKSLEEVLLLIISHTRYRFSFGLISVDKKIRLKSFVLTKEI